MLLGYPIGEIVLLALWIVGAGILVGVLAGLFGIGGGAVIVPVLYEVFRALDVPEEVRMQLCIGTSLAIIVPTTVRSYIAHKKKGAVIPQVVRIWAVPAVVGVAIGSVIAAFAPAQVFKIVFVDFRRLDRATHAVRRATAGISAPICRAAADADVLRLHHRPDLVAGGRHRRLGVERGAHASMASSMQQRGGDLGRRRRADHDRRHHRLHAGRLAASWRRCRRCRSASCR